MLSNIIKIRVRYSETDQMSFVYHGNYAQYFEMGRTEWLRELGITYKNMEESGIMLPVISLNINFIKNEKYDDLLSLKTNLIKKPTAKIDFNYELRNISNELLTTANSTLVFVNMKTNRPMRVPTEILEKIEKFIL